MIIRLVTMALLAIAVNSPGDADARDHARHGKNARGKGKERLHAALALSDSQKEQLKTLRAQHRTERQELRESSGISREEIKALRKQHHEEFLQLLTNEQREKLRGMRADRQGKKRQPRAKHRGKWKELGLSENQKDQFKALRQQRRAAMENLRESGDFARDDMQALRKQYRQAFLAILTEDQRVKMKTWKSDSHNSTSKMGKAKIGEPDVNAGVSTSTVIERTTWGRIKADEEK